MKLFRLAGFGSIGGFLFFLFIIVTGVCTPASSGGKNIIGVCVDWLASPFGWFLEWLLKRDLIMTDNVPTVLLIQMVYWMVLGAIIALVSSSFLRSQRPSGK